MEDTLIGFALNELMFCSNENHDFFLNTTCPVDCVTRDNPFWNAASVNFAKQARGEITVVLNGTRTFGAFVDTSTFYRFELPNIDPKQVPVVKVLLMHDLDIARHETCKQPKTLQKLEAILKDMNIKYECQDDLYEVTLLMCSRNPNAKECQSLTRNSSFNKPKINLPFEAFLLFIQIFLITNFMSFL